MTPPSVPTVNAEDWDAAVKFYTMVHADSLAEAFARHREAAHKAGLEFGYRHAIAVAQNTPFRAHNKEDVEFHSGCVQTRDRIVRALEGTIVANTALRATPAAPEAK